MSRSPVLFQHAPSLNQCSESAWQELARFRTALQRMFAEENDEGVVYIETAMSLGPRCHASLEVGDVVLAKPFQD